MLTFVCFLIILTIAQSLYSSNSAVVQVTDRLADISSYYYNIIIYCFLIEYSSFKQEVLQFPGVVIVEFYAPWSVIKVLIHSNFRIHY